MREGWRIEVLDNIVDVKGGKRLPKGERLLDLPTGLPYIRVTDFENYTVNTSNLKYIEPRIQERIKNYIIKKEDVFISIAGTIGFVGKIPDELDGANLTENAARLIIKNKKLLDRDYLVFFLSANHNKEDLLSRMSKNAQPKLSLSNIKSFQLLLPPLPEQRKIAYILSTVQKAIEQQDQLIRTTIELKKALMQKLFTEGIKGEKQKQSEIGLLPESWEVVELGDVCERISVNVQPNPDGERPYVGLEHIVPGQIYLTSWGKESEVVSSKAAFKKGEILYGKLRPYLDKAVIAHFDGISSTDILIFTGRDNVENDFLIHFFHTERLIDFAKSTTTGVQHPRTSWSSLKKIKLGLPSNAERKLIAQTLNLFENKLSFHQKKKQALTDLFKTLLHELMTGQRRVHELKFAGLAKEYELKEQTLSLAAEK